MTSNCLIEIGTEELPPKALKTLSSDFSRLINEGLKSKGLAAQNSQSFATPRRLAVLLNNVPTQQPDKQIEKKGPALKAAYDAEGNPSKAAAGFARSCGVEVADLVQRETDKGIWLYYQGEEKGASLENLIAAIVDKALAQLPIPKRMRWGDRDDEFVRPIKWFVLMLDDNPVEAEIMGVRSGRQTFGHRFHAPQAIDIPTATDYERLIVSEGLVIVNFEKRKEKIKSQIELAAARLDGHARIDEDLLDEVTALVEYPVAICGEFEADFLQVPQEALVMTMQDNQKYFALFNQNNELMPFFITISNIDSKRPEVVANGNQRVIRPRFADAQFFFEQDQKTRLADRIEKLDTVIFQKKLGSIGDKVRRVSALAEWIADQIDADKHAVKRASQLCKCDLLTDMVGEFPKLQGIMARYYALHDNESEDVANAAEQHYWPKFAGDNLPLSKTGQAVALADRVDSLIGIFSIGQKPTGVKDPFALRRAALGVVRLLIELRLAINLPEMLQQSADLLEQQAGTSINASDAKQVVLDYIFDRLKGYYQDQAISADVVDAVAYDLPANLSDCDLRVKAVFNFQSNEAAPALAAANKRISNILKKQAGENAGAISTALLQNPAEKNLVDQLNKVKTSVDTAFANGEYSQGLEELASLRPAVDDFFEQVMVMDENPDLRNNRLAILANLQASFRGVADFARIQTG